MIHEAKIPAQQILMVTFSSAAAKEMKTRYQKKFGMDAVNFFNDSFYVYVYLKEIRRIYERIHLF